MDDLGYTFYDAVIVHFSIPLLRGISTAVCHSSWLVYCCCWCYGSSAVTGFVSLVSYDRYRYCICCLATVPLASVQFRQPSSNLAPCFLPPSFLVSLLYCCSSCHMPGCQHSLLPPPVPPGLGCSIQLKVQQELFLCLSAAGSKYMCNLA